MKRCLTSRAPAALAVALAFAAGCRTAPESPPGTPARALARGPVVQNVTAHSAVFLGRPAGTATGSVVTVRVKPAFRREIRAEGRFDPARDTFEIPVAGLPAATRCAYTIETAGGRVGPLTFRTAPERPRGTVRFAVYGDTRTQTNVHATVAAAIAPHQPEFVLCTGDLVENGRERPQWDGQFFAPAAPLAATSPIYPCLGNHDQRAPGYFDLFALPQPEAYYTFTWGPVRVITLDQYSGLAPGDEQYAWFEHTLAAPFAGWTVVQFHEPPFGANESRGINRKWVDRLVPLLEKYGADLVTCGHDHHYVRAVPLANKADGHPVQYLVCGGGGAPLYPASSDLPWVAAATTAYHYVVLEASPKRLSGTTYALDGRVLDRFALSRKAPAQPRSWSGWLDVPELRVALREALSLLPLYPGQKSIALTFTNPLERELRVSLAWAPADSGWTVKPAVQEHTVGPAGTVDLAFAVTPPDGAARPAPQAILTVSGQDLNPVSMRAPLYPEKKPDAAR